MGRGAAVSLLRPVDDTGGVVDTKRPLLRTTERLITHLTECPACQYSGGKFCLDVDGFVRAVERAQVLARKSMNGAPPAATT